MSIENREQTETPSQSRTTGLIATGGVIVSHTLQHLYGEGFYVVLPVIYTALGLNPVAAGFIGTVRQISSGFSSMIGGFLIDQFQNRRKLVLYFSLLIMGLGYLLVGVSPTYYLILASVALAGAAGSLWHPAALSLISQRYPLRRGFMMALHRSSGNAGDAIGPLLVGALLVVLSWQNVLFGAFPLAVIMSLLLWTALHRDTGWDQPVRVTAKSVAFKDQMIALKGVMNRELILLLLVSGVAGLGQGSLMLWLPMYLQEARGMGSLGIGLHLGLLSSVGIASGPVIGFLSDRFGRKVVIFIVLAIKVVIATLMALAGADWMLTVLVGLMGAVLFALNPLVQAGALDIAEGKKLEGSMIGLLWGNNAIFSGLAPVLVGLLITSQGYGILFWYIAAMNTVAALFAIWLMLATSKKKVLPQT